MTLRPRPEPLTEAEAHRLAQSLEDSARRQAGELTPAIKATREAAQHLIDAAFDPQRFQKRRTRLDLSQLPAEPQIPPAKTA